MKNNLSNSLKRSDNCSFSLHEPLLLCRLNGLWGVRAGWGYLGGVWSSQAPGGSGRLWRENTQDLCQVSELMNTGHSNWRYTRHKHSFLFTLTRIQRVRPKLCLLRKLLVKLSGDDNIMSCQQDPKILWGQSCFILFCMTQVSVEGRLYPPRLDINHRPHIYNVIFIRCVSDKFSFLRAGALRLFSKGQ